MLDRVKILIKKNNFFYSICHTVYIPLRNFRLRKIKKKCRDEAIDLLKNDESKTLNIYYLGIPIHSNLGDLAQTYCTLKYFKDYFSDYHVFPIKTYATYYKSFLKILKSKIKENDLIIFQSGYCTTDNHLDHKMHKIIVKNFPKNRIVFLPQTVLFKSKNEKKKTANIFNKHGKILFLARDEVSFYEIKEAFNKIRVEQYPDIVTTLIGKEFKNSRNGVILCIRNDEEKLYSSIEIQRLKKTLESTFDKIICTDTTEKNLEIAFTLESLEKTIMGKIDSFSSAEIIITDRYHGTIFSLVANTPVIVLASNDHKVKTGVKWFKGLYNSIFYASSIEEAIELALKAKNLKEIYNKPYFEEKYYSKLGDLIVGL